MMNRNLDLGPREEGTRNTYPRHTTAFELEEIKTHFTNNLQMVEEQFDLVENLKDKNDLKYKDILRAQVVFVLSAFDYFMHEITKYGMLKIFRGEWGKTEKYKNYKVTLGDVSDPLYNCQMETWFLDHVNTTYEDKTFMGFDKVRDQLNLIGVNYTSVAREAFYERGSEKKEIEKFKEALDSMFKRRNAIAHQLDCSHKTGEKMDIERDDVKKYIETIKNIVEAICKEIRNKDGESCSE